MIKRTKKEIDEQICLLKEIVDKPSFRRFTIFQDDNREALNAQIEVLEECLTEDDCDDRETMGDWSEHATGSARGAAAWLSGESDDPPAGDWKGLY